MAPRLTLELGSHAAMIRRLDTDARGKWLVTASDDHSARIWSLPRGELRQILRPRTATGNEGKVFSVAMAPDAQEVAVGGWLGHDLSGGHSVLMFRRQTGQVARRISGFANVVYHLSYSVDGQRVAAAMGGTAGLRIFAPGTGKILAEDSSYGGHSMWATFSRNGRLATSCWDGLVRLYDAANQPMVSVKIPGGKQPYGLAFSDDGKLLAVGFFDSTALVVVDSVSLAVRHVLPAQRGDNGDLGRVAWSADQRTLFAGGSYQSGDRLAIRAWQPGLEGVQNQFAIADNTIMDLRRLPNGLLAFVSQDPRMGLLDRRMSSVLDVRSPLPDFREVYAGALGLAQGATQVVIGTEPEGKNPVVFSVLESRMVRGPSALVLRGPVARTSAATLTDWRNAPAPKINGNAIALKPHELSRSGTLTPDSLAAVIGADWSLRKVDLAGRLAWERATPAAIWGVAVDPGGRVLVAACGDGTVRWHRVDNGEEILALFMSRYSGQWVAWTPSGYYAASQGADELLGWQVNRGLDAAADFFPVARFRHQFARPDVVYQILRTLDEPEALRSADALRGLPSQGRQVEQILPPVVTVLSPTHGAEVRTSSIQLAVQVRSLQSRGATELEVAVDGVVARKARGAQLVGEASAGGATHLVHIEVPPRDAIVSVVARQGDTSSEAAILRLRWAGPPPDRALLKAKDLHVLSIGVSQYARSELRLAYGTADARAFADLWAQQQGRTYRRVTVRPLLDPTAAEVRNGFAWLLGQVGPDDVTIVFLAGHGATERGSYYFLPVDADPSNLFATAIPWTDIKRLAEDMHSRVVLFVDTCHAATALGDNRRTLSTDVLVADMAAPDVGVVMFAASTAKQYSLEDPAWGHGAFTLALLESLRGASTGARVPVTVASLMQQLSDRVDALTGGRQTPTIGIPRNVPNFVLAWSR